MQCSTYEAICLENAFTSDSNAFPTKLATTPVNEYEKENTLPQVPYTSFIFCLFLFIFIFCNFLMQVCDDRTNSWPTCILYPDVTPKSKTPMASQITHLGHTILNNCYVYSIGYSELGYYSLYY